MGRIERERKVTHFRVLPWAVSKKPVYCYTAVDFSRYGIPNQLLGDA